MMSARTSTSQPPIATPISTATPSPPTTTPSPSPSPSPTASLPPPALLPPPPPPPTSLPIPSILPPQASISPAPSPPLVTVETVTTATTARTLTIQTRNSNQASIHNAPPAITLDYAQLYLCPEPISGPKPWKYPQLQQPHQRQYSQLQYNSRNSLTTRTTPTYYQNYPYSYNIHHYIGGSGSIGGSAPIGRNYRFYHSEANYRSGGSVINFGRISPAVAHTTPLLATSASSGGSAYSSSASLAREHRYLAALPPTDLDYGPPLPPLHSGSYGYKSRRDSGLSASADYYSGSASLGGSVGGASVPPAAVEVLGETPTATTAPTEDFLRTSPITVDPEAGKTSPHQHHHHHHHQHQHHHQQQQHQQQQQQQPHHHHQQSDTLPPHLSQSQSQSQQQHHQQQHHQEYQEQQRPQHDDSCEEFNNIGDDTTTCIGKHRMMVSKLWTSCFPEFMNEHVHRHNFYLCQWQRNTQVRIVYLFYRWIAAITCLAALVCSLLDIGRTDEHFENHYAKWWIYLTHWGLLFCTIQAWLAAWIVTQGMMVEREDFEIVRQAKKSRLHHLYWVLYTCATVYSFIITMCYWLLVHNPEIHKIDTLNIMVHVFNSVIMLIDLAIVGHPIKLSHAYFTTGIGLAYAIFTGIYFLAGGTDRKNQTAIYPMLDWTKPGKAIIVTACAIIFVFVIHFCCYLLYRARVWLFTKLCIRGSHTRDGDMGEGLNDDSVSRLGGGSAQDYAHQQQYPIVQSEQPHHSHHLHHHQQQQQQQHQQQQQQQHQQQQQLQHQQPAVAGVGQTISHHSAGMIATPSHNSPQYHPQYAGYQQQPVVAGVNVGVISSGGIYQQQDNNNKQHKSHTSGSGGGAGSGSTISRSVAHLDAAQREQFLNPNKIVEYKM